MYVSITKKKEEKTVSLEKNENYFSFSFGTSGITLENFDEKLRRLVEKNSNKC